jgi:hypothetical protein
MEKAVELKIRARLAVKILYGHGRLPPAFRCRSLEDALGLFPSYPQGPIDPEQDKLFVGAVRKKIPALRDLEGELADLVEQLDSAPLSVVASPHMLPPAEPKEGAGAGRDSARAGHGGGAATARNEGGTGQGKDTGKRRRAGGKPSLERSDPKKFQVYQRIQRDHQPGEPYADVVSRLKEDKDFGQQVKDAGLKLTTKLVRAALAFFGQRERDAARKKQETDPA